jgi:hypothetical protein
MIEKTDTEGKRPFFGNDTRDNLIDWASKIETLGHVLSALAWHEAQGKGSTDTLEMYGETFGMIITDYAEQIRQTVTEKGYQEDPLSFHRKSLEWIEDSKGEGGSEGVIGIHLKKLDDFVKTVAAPAFELQERFKEMQKKYPVRRESAPAAVSAAAEA